MPITANNFERLSNKTSNKWRDMIKVKPSAFAAGADGAAAAPPAGGRRAHSLREWAARRGVALGDPDVEAATAQCTIPYDDERVPLDGVGREHHIEEGWVAVEDPAAGGFAIGYVWHNPQVRARARGGVIGGDAWGCLELLGVAGSGRRLVGAPAAAAAAGQPSGQHRAVRIADAPPPVSPFLVPPTL